MIDHERAFSSPELEQTSFSYPCKSSQVSLASHEKYKIIFWAEFYDPFLSVDDCGERTYTYRVGCSTVFCLESFQKLFKLKFGFFQFDVS